MLFTTIVSGSVLFFLAQYSYNEIIVFGIAITLLSSLTASLLQGNSYMYAVILGLSIFGVLGIEYLGFLNTNILSTQLLMSQLFVNIGVVSLLFIYQAYQALNPLKDKRVL